MYEITLYLLAGALVLLGWSCCRLFPQVPDSGGIRGMRFWLALLLAVAFDRVLNTAFLTAETSLFDADDAVLALIEASTLFVVTGIVMRTPHPTA
jgi:hypothetical protein